LLNKIMHSSAEKCKPLRNSAEENEIPFQKV